VLWWKICGIGSSRLYQIDRDFQIGPQICEESFI
jgi:hypothetical protein